MTAGDRSLYYGFWGITVGFGLFFGWRLTLPLLAPAATYIFTFFITGTDFDPILASTILNLGLDLIAGLLVSILLSILIRIILKPSTMFFLLVPFATFLGSGYWWLISSYLDDSFYPNNSQLLLYIAGPLLVALAFVAAFRMIALKDPVAGLANRQKPAHSRPTNP